MKSRSIFLLHLTVVFILSGCHRSTDPSLPFATFEHHEGKLYLSDYADSIVYIPLDTRGEVLMSGQIMPHITDRHILIEDEAVQQVLLFDREGNFIRKIGGRGRSQEEYGELIGVAIDENAERIFVGDNIRKRLIVYDLEGRYINEIPLGYYYGGFHILKEGEILVFTRRYMRQEDHAPNVLVVDYNGQELYRANLSLPFANAKSTFIHFYRYQDRLCIIPQNSMKDSVFYINDKYEIVPHLEFKYDGRKDKHTLIDFNEYFSQSEGSLDLGMSPFESERLIFAPHSTFELQRKEYIYDKSLGKSFASCHYDMEKKLFRIGLINDLDGGIPFFPSGQINEEWLFAVRSSRGIKRYEENQHYGDTLIRDHNAHQHLVKLASALTEESDYIIQLVRFKPALK